MKRTFAFLSLVLLVLSVCAPVVAPTSVSETGAAWLHTATPAPNATPTPMITFISTFLEASKSCLTAYHSSAARTACLTSAALFMCTA